VQFLARQGYINPPERATDVHWRGVEYQKVRLWVVTWEGVGRRVKSNVGRHVTKEVLGCHVKSCRLPHRKSKLWVVARKVVVMRKVVSGKWLDINGKLLVVSGKLFVMDRRAKSCSSCARCLTRLARLRICANEGSKRHVDSWHRCWR